MSQTQIFKFRIRKEEKQTKICNNPNINNNSNINNNINIGYNGYTVSSQTLYSFTTNVITLFLILCCFLVPLKMNKFKGSEINKFPNYLWVYLLHHFIAESTFALLIFVHFGKTEALGKRVWNYLNKKLNKFIQIFQFDNNIYPIEFDEKINV